ncbi:pilus assembly protein [Sphingomonas sp. LC-1]|uniref:pilus assembly protein n=1 Tax=Sphingomonas sp. LC-1 TaxID=3110957 RepID=UPI0021BA4138|nr:TadE/TadG family type IV pilus assembly protein [Sphingomonas sp. LC-1]
MAGLLARLAGDRRGNVMALWVFSLIPLVALVGSAIDLGTGYVTRKQMQIACDAGVLAGRRAMTAGAVDDTVRAEATKFFNFNYRQGLYGSKPFTPSISSTTTSKTTVVIDAATTVPTSIMRIFGFTELPVKVSCNASQDFVNTDIVFVLDTTGSMADKATPSDTSTKIQALRAAVLALYDQLAPIQTQLTASGMRLRYGVVPYSSAVNVGKAIRAANPNYMLSGPWTYQSREVVTDNRSSSSCSQLNGNYNFWQGRCTYFNYAPRSFDTSNYVSGATVDVGPLIGTANSSGVTPTNTTSKRVSWAGCIEERQTVRMSATEAAIPAGATDLNINLIPSTEATKWKPYWPDIEYLSYKYQELSNDPYKPQVACPTAAAAMQVWTKGDLKNYLDTLIPDGGTYHDNGMMWGARWASSGGIFGPANPDTYNTMPVKKYIIFMTDGTFATGYSYLYSSYGIEQLDARVTPGGGWSNQTDQLARHQQRFNLLCSQAKSMGYSVWVIGFDTALDASLTNCASTPSQASTSSDQAALMARFVEIGKNIGALRLTQ